MVALEFSKFTVPVPHMEVLHPAARAMSFAPGLRIFTTRLYPATGEAKS